MSYRGGSSGGGGQGMGGGGGGGGGRGQGRGMGAGRGMGGGRGLGPRGECVCRNCGEIVSHQPGVPCYESKCPKCGQPMTRK